MRKGYDREGRVAAIIRFLMGIVFFILVVGILYYFFVVQDNYSDRIEDASRTVRPYVVSQQTPLPSQTPDLAPAAAQPSEETTLPPYATPTPTPATPTPDPTPSPTPEPTGIPESALAGAVARTDAQIPPLSDTVRAGITNCYVSAVDGYKIMQIDGYAYIDDPRFDGENSSCYLVVRKDSAAQNLAYLTTSVEGVSGIEHEGQGQNLAKADFSVFIDVSGYTDDVYSLGVVLMSTYEGQELRLSYRFPGTMTFAVRSGEVISPVQVSQ